MSVLPLLQILKSIRHRTPLQFDAAELQGAQSVRKSPAAASRTILGCGSRGPHRPTFLSHDCEGRVVVVPGYINPFTAARSLHHTRLLTDGVSPDTTTKQHTTLLRGNCFMSFLRVSKSAPYYLFFYKLMSYRTKIFLRSVRRLLVTANVVPSSPILVTLMVEALVSSETSALTRATRR
jgi:hypothetical protein